MAKRDKGINPDLERFVNALMAEVMQDTSASVTDKVKVLDRALKLEAIKQKVQDDEWGSGLMAGDEDEQD
jgi:hypothetical protein